MRARRHAGAATQHQLISHTLDEFGWDYETVASRPDVSTVTSFHFDPNGEPVVMYRERLVPQGDKYVRMSRRDSDGGWTTMTIDPNGVAQQGAVFDMVYASDGNLYVTMSNLGSQVPVGRFCEDRSGIAGNNITCTPTVDVDGNNVWLWENAADAGDSGWSIAIDSNGGTIAVIGNKYYSCNPLSGASVISSVG